MPSELYYIASIGLDENDIRVLHALIAISKSRSISFLLYEAGGEKKVTDIVLVDADNPTAVNKWTTYIKSIKSESPVLSVLICSEVPPDNPNDHNHYIKKPLTATLLLTTLEKLVQEEFSSEAQDLFFGDEGDSSSSAEPADVEGKINALVVDDSLPVRIQMKKALQSISKSVDFAETGEEAESLIQKNKYDIVFLDVILPDIDGYEVCKFIKKNNESKSTPVIMLTSNSSPADRMKGKMAGCDTYLIKPVRHDIFKEVIFEYLEIDI